MAFQLNRKKNVMTLQEQQAFFDIISNFISSGLRLEDGIAAYQEDFPKDSYNYHLCASILKDMKNGHSFSEAIKKFPKSFSPFTTGIIAMAEGTGHFSASLSEISFRQELQSDIKSKIDSATLVPKISAGFGLLAFLVSTAWAIPKMAETLESLDAELPLITKAVLYFGSFMSSFWWLFILFLIGLKFYYEWLKTNKPELLATIMMKLPFWKPISINRLRYDFCTIMGICIEAGIEPVQALTYTGMASDNIFLKGLITRALRHVKNNGTPYDEALQKEDAIPLLDNKLYRMLKSGRTTGRTGEIMQKQAEFYRKKLIIATNEVGDKVGMSVITPIYVFIGIMVAAIVLPIIGLAGNAAMQAL